MPNNTFLPVQNIPANSFPVIDGLTAWMIIAGIMSVVWLLGFIVFVIKAWWTSR